MSSTRTETATVPPAALYTLVAPMLPLPYFLMSIFLTARHNRYPQGILPNKYAPIMIDKTIITYMLKTSFTLSTAVAASAA